MTEQKNNVELMNELISKMTIEERIAANVATAEEKKQYEDDNAFIITAESCKTKNSYHFAMNSFSEIAMKKLIDAKFSAYIVTKTKNLYVMNKAFKTIFIKYVDSLITADLK